MVSVDILMLQKGMACSELLAEVGWRWCWWNARPQESGRTLPRAPERQGEVVLTTGCTGLGLSFGRSHLAAAEISSTLGSSPRQACVGGEH